MGRRTVILAFVIGLVLPHFAVAQETGVTILIGATEKLASGCLDFAKWCTEHRDNNRREAQSESVGLVARDMLQLSLTKAKLATVFRQIAKGNDPDPIELQDQVAQSGLDLRDFAADLHNQIAVLAPDWILHHQDDWILLNTIYLEKTQIIGQVLHYHFVHRVPGVIPSPEDASISATDLPSLADILDRESRKLRQASARLQAAEQPKPQKR